MEDEIAELRAQAMIRQMTVTMLTKYFLDLAAAFAATDKRAAHQAINAVAQDVSRGLFQLRSELVKGAGADHILVPVASNLRETVNLARETIERATR
jgi:hypothetical protein